MKSLVILFIFLFVSVARAQFEKVFSISDSKMPLAVFMQEVLQEKHPEIYRKRLALLSYFPDAKDTVTGTLHQESQWRFLEAHCHAQWGQWDQNQAYGATRFFESKDTLSSWSGSAITNAFRADTAFAFDGNIHLAFNGADEGYNTWYIAQSGDILLIKLLHHVNDMTDKENTLQYRLNTYYHREEYWYFFRRKR